MSKLLRQCHLDIYPKPFTDRVRLDADGSPDFDDAVRRNTSFSNQLISIVIVWQIQ